jgi:FMN-dependent NADH-azoreductase
MSTLLYVKASPRGARSHSIHVADAFAEAWVAAGPNREIAVRELFAMDLPAFDGHLLQVKYNIMHGRPHSPEEKKAWQAVEALIADFKAADRYLFAVPMWNFSIPYRLKHYLDLIVQPTYTFLVGPEGYTGLVTGRKAFLCLARGGDYPAGSGREQFDFQSGYLRHILGFIGLSDVAGVAVEPTLRGEELKDKARRDALAKALEIAKTF